MITGGSDGIVKETPLRLAEAGTNALYKQWGRNVSLCAISKTPMTLRADLCHFLVATNQRV